MLNRKCNCKLDPLIIHLYAHIVAVPKILEDGVHFQAQSSPSFIASCHFVFHSVRPAQLPRGKCWALQSHTCTFSIGCTTSPHLLPILGEATILLPSWRVQKSLFLSICRDCNGVVLLCNVLRLVADFSSLPSLSGHSTSIPCSQNHSC